MCWMSGSSERYWFIILSVFTLCLLLTSLLKSMKESVSTSFDLIVSWKNGFYFGRSSWSVLAVEFPSLTKTFVLRDDSEYIKLSSSTDSNSKCSLYSSSELASISLILIVSDGASLYSSVIV